MTGSFLRCTFLALLVPLLMKGLVRNVDAIQQMDAEIIEVEDAIHSLGLWFAYQRLFADKTKQQLQSLQDEKNVGIAIQARWTILNQQLLSDAEDSVESIPPDRELAVGFLDFVEEKLDCPIP